MKFKQALFDGVLCGVEDMTKDIIGVYYYSSPKIPDECYLKLSPDILYRNMFFLPCGEYIHFEFPMFEDHSYNTICNCHGVKNLIKKKSNKDKYILFRTKNCETNESNIVGYYKVGEAYYQKTDMFDNNGFVWGIKSSESHLVKKGSIIYDGPRFPRKYVCSWKSDKWNKILSSIISRIQEEENVEDLYQTETNRLIDIFKSNKKINEWKNHCITCEVKNQCTLNRRYRRYQHYSSSDMFKLFSNVYKSNLYSRNVLEHIPKIKIEWEGEVNGN